MNKREIKKTYAPGTLVAIQGTNFVFMSLGYDGAGGLISFNGVNIISGELMDKVRGKIRPATKRESFHYWKIIRKLIEK